MDFRAYLEKLRGLSDKNKKIVLWTIVVVLGLMMGFFWIKGAGNALSNLGSQMGNVQLPNIETQDTDVSDAINNLINQVPVETLDWKTYKNKEYGFELVFPDSWEGYSVISDLWRAWDINSSSSASEYYGVKIIFTNPNAKKNPGEAWQNIPIMIITPDVWDLILQGRVAVSAAPIGPERIGQNKKYIFATPPRWYGFTDALGWQEAVDIVKTFKAF